MKPLKLTPLEVGDILSDPSKNVTYDEFGGIVEVNGQSIESFTLDEIGDAYFGDPDLQTLHDTGGRLVAASYDPDFRSKICRIRGIL